MEKTECVGAIATGGLRHDIQGWDRTEVRIREERQGPSAREDRRLKPIYTPLDGGSTSVPASFRLPQKSKYAELINPSPLYHDGHNG